MIVPVCIIDYEARNINLNSNGNTNYVIKKLEYVVRILKKKRKKSLKSQRVEVDLSCACMILLSLATLLMPCQDLWKQNDHIFPAPYI